MTRLFVSLAALFGALTLAVPVASAVFAQSAAVGSNTFVTDQLNPPTGLSAGANGSDVDLTWTPTVDTYASGYRIFRSTSSGGPYTQVDQVSGQATVAYTDVGPGTGTFFYVVRSFYEQWESADSGDASAMLP